MRPQRRADRHARQHYGLIARLTMTHTTFAAIVQRHHVDAAAEKLAPLGERWRQLIEFPREFGIIVVLADRPSQITHATAADLPAAIRAAVAQTAPDAGYAPVLWAKFVDGEIDRDVIHPLLVELHEAEGNA